MIEYILEKIQICNLQKFQQKFLRIFDTMDSFSLSNF